MTIRTFWTILLKIMGIYLVFGSLSIIPQFFTSLTVIGEFEGAEFFLILIGLIITLGLYVLTLRLFVFRPEWLIDKLDLNKGFTEDRFEINIHRSTILKISIIVLGGIFLVESLPFFCEEMFSYFQQKSNPGMFGGNHTSSWIIFYFVKALLGYLMMTNCSYITNLIERNRKQSTASSTE
jgi:hypothetical protein